MNEKRIPIPESLSQGQYETQTETLEVKKKSSRLFIGIPKETTYQENRVALAPSSVEMIVGQEHRVVLEAGAGIRSNFSDQDYSEAGAEIAQDREHIFKADIIIKVAPPTPEEIELLKPNQILISPIHLPVVTAEYLNKLRDKRVIALAMEYIQDEVGSFPIVRILSEIAGYSAMLTAAELLSKSSKGIGMLLGGISGVPSANVVILGAGVVAEFATRTAIGLGCEIRIFDNNIYKLKRLQNQIGRRLYTSAINPITLAKELQEADVAIGAIHSKSGRAPMLVNEEMVANMKEGSVIIDVSIDQGGCFATSRLTDHDKPTFEENGVIHYCVPNIASKVSRTASRAVSNILTPILLKMAAFGGLENLLNNNIGLRNGVYTYKGCLTNEYLGERFGIKTTSLDLLITSNL